MHNFSFYLFSPNQIMERLFPCFFLLLYIFALAVDSEGNVPLWEAIKEKHESIIKILVEKGGNIYSGDVGLFACVAAEQNDLNLLKDIVKYGGDVKLPSKNGTTALHVAVCEGNAEIVKFLLDHSAHVDRPDPQGWTPQELADQQGHEEIKDLLLSRQEMGGKTSFQVTVQPRVLIPGRFTSEPTLRPLPKEDRASPTNVPGRRESNSFCNSLFGIMSAAHASERVGQFSVDNATFSMSSEYYPARVTVSCPELNISKKMIHLPDSFPKLLGVCTKKFGFKPTKILTRDGAEIDEIEVIRDGDHLVLVGEDS